MTAAPWTVTTTHGRPVAVTVTLRPSAAPADRDALLSAGIVDLVAAMVAAATGTDPVVVDLRCLEGGDARAVEAYVAAARGLVQSFVLERSAPSGPVNLVVSAADQDADRHATLSYLGSSDGGFSWGACYDLREDAS
ncbi:hypothetical protein [Nakamurella deserti]|uniref:hypothetical protein n=1 Tax=Nakamurella deserti TaxID=2164074 RepID=UPI001300B99A|nr:hypothetical protein [Nakamurella deserti]